MNNSQKKIAEDIQGANVAKIDYNYVLSKLTETRQEVVKSIMFDVQMLPTLNIKNAEIEVRGIPLSDHLISKESVVALLSEYLTQEK